MILETNGIRLEGEAAGERRIYMLCGGAERTEGVISVSGMEWNRDLSPWPAKAAFARSGDFAGGAGEFLRRLLAAVEEFERAQGGGAQPRCLAGYSLAGLFCLYAACESDAFSGVASVSGSLWYDGFVDYLRARPVRAKRIYLSLGDRESRARDPRLARVGECTQMAVEIFRGDGAETCFEWNAGNHFQDPMGRMERAVRFLKKDRIEVFGDGERKNWT